MPELTLPVRSLFIDPGFEDVEGHAITDTESIHHRKETVAGVGDLRLLAVLPILTDPDGMLLTARVGASLPVGHVEPDPGALGREGKEHQHIFFGSGTFDPVVGVEAALPTEGGVLFTGRGEIHAPLYRGEHDYRQGVRASAEIGVHWLFGEWRFGLRPGTYFETASTWGSSPAENSGRLDAIVSASGVWTPASGPAWALTLGKPITVFTDGGQFDTLVQGTLSVAWRIGAPAEPDSAQSAP